MIRIIIGGEIMNDLLERYLGAVCSYFIGPRRNSIYHDLKHEIQSSAYHYDDLEDLLVSYGHPRCIALGYGYRPFTQHIFNPSIVNLMEKVIFIISGVYLFFSTIYYLFQFNCLPFLASEHVVTTINTSTFLLQILSYPLLVIGGIGLISLIFLLIIDRRQPVNQEINPSWSLEKLYKLPHQSHYPHHIVETLFMIVFTIYFIIFAVFFNQDIIMQIQHESYKMIHLMTYFFQPFIVIIYLDYIIDMTKKIYTKKYLKYSSIINVFTIISLSIFVINSHHLKDYLLPFGISLDYTLVNIFIIGALLMIYSISLYKLSRNIKSYYSLFKK